MAGASTYIYGRKKRSFVVVINQLLLLLLTAVCMLTPLYGFQKMIVLLGLFAMWYVTTITIDPKWIDESVAPLLFLVAILLLDFFYGAVTNNSELESYGFNKIPTFMWVVPFVFYSKRTYLLNNYVYLTFIILLISSGLTISGNILFPGASRLLASGNHLEAVRGMYRAMGIGGYDFIFALVFLIMPAIISIQQKTFNALFFIISIAVFIVTILFGAYMIGILFAIFSGVLAIATRKRKISFKSILIIGIAAALVFGFLFDFLADFGERYGIDVLGRRSEEITTGTYGDREDDMNRIVLYKNGILNWLSRPFFGDLEGGNETLLPSGHSELIGFLERYGIFSLLYFGFLRRFYLSVKRRITSDNIRASFKLYYLIILIFMLIDRFDTSVGIGFVVFFLAPLLFIIASSNSKELSK